MQINLVGNAVEISAKKTEAHNRKKPAPWDGICCEACWNAAEDDCTCRCGGRHHGRGKLSTNSLLQVHRK